MTDPTPRAIAEQEAPNWCCSACGGPVAARNSVGASHGLSHRAVWQLRCSNEECPGYNVDRLKRAVLEGGRQ